MEPLNSRAATRIERMTMKAIIMKTKLKSVTVLPSPTPGVRRPRAAKKETQARRWLSALLMVTAFVESLPTAFGQGTAFTYQGQLASGGAPANGSYDISFTLFNTNADGVAVAGSVTNAGTAVSNGLFMATIDFGPAVFTGSNYWLELAVQTNGGSGFTTLAPRQSITPTPYAIYAPNAGNAATATTAASASSVSASNIIGKLGLGQLPGAVLTNNQAGVSISVSNLSVTATSQIAPLSVPPRVPGSVAGSVFTYQPQAVAVSGRYAYVVYLSASTLQIFDVSDPSSPVGLGTASTGRQPWFVAVAGRYAYIVNGNGNSLQIFDVSNPSSPVNVGTAGTGPVGPISVAVAGRYAYVANVANSLQIFDVSNPFNPMSVGTASTGSGSNPRSVAVSGRYAYVANNAGNSLQIF